MPFYTNLPFFSVIILMCGAVICSLTDDRKAGAVCKTCLIITILFSAIVFVYTSKAEESFIYVLGHYPAPWGNEFRAGPLEAFACMGFSIILLVSLMGGGEYIRLNIRKEKRNRYFILINLICVAMTAIVYTNDLFTAYVFLEILTLASCGILMIKDTGKTTIAATRYLILNLLGSGLFLLGIFFIYTMTGHLLMENINEAITGLISRGEYTLPLTVATGILLTGLAIKSGLFPFHLWMPDTYAYSTPTSSAILSSYTSKVYIFLLIKIITRIIGTETAMTGNILRIFLIFGLIAIIIGSVSAIRQHNINRMIAFSSTSQIGYIYVAMAISGNAGIVASLFHIFAHSITKTLLFLSSAKIIEVSDNDMSFHSQRGAARRAPFAGAMFAVGALSITGIPPFAGFASKILISQVAANEERIISLIILLILAVSTMLNTVYFLRTLINIYSASPDNKNREDLHPQYAAALVILCVINIFFGIYSGPITSSIKCGLELFV